MLIETDRLFDLQIKPPALLLPWLEHQASLTNRLRSYTQEVRLAVLAQHWVNPNWWDKATLSLQVTRLMQREVLILAGQRPCWYARTIIPESSYQANQAFFSRLGQESLGDIIFKEATIRRKQLFYYAVNQQCLEYYWLLPYCSSQATELWARLSVFTIADSWPFYLVELLLPDLLEICN